MSTVSTFLLLTLISVPHLKNASGLTMGGVAAHVSVGSNSCYITTNTDYVPGLPPTGDDLFLRQDMRWAQTIPHCGLINTAKHIAI
ncbi:hypothetical protein B0H14DRAFT_3458358 [Mycena olivaceomarginata]|nr:hypothetical protein B0H14DRAFT_3458358 [Mycena olivaceomarginata]